MNFFSISDIESLTGIKAHTLRIWEQRYKMFNPKRKESRHRQYDNEDLKYILRIAFLYNNGYKISKIAGFSEEEIKKLALTITYIKKREKSWSVYFLDIDGNKLEMTAWPLEDKG